MPVIMVILVCGFSAGKAMAQNVSHGEIKTTSGKEQPSLFRLPDDYNSKFFCPPAKNGLDPHVQLSVKSKTGFILSSVATYALPSPAYYQQHWGMFCELEWQTEKKIKLPLSFRLGSLEYVNHLEGKDR